MQGSSLAANRRQSWTISEIDLLIESKGDFGITRLLFLEGEFGYLVTECTERAKDTRTKAPGVLIDKFALTQQNMYKSRLRYHLALPRSGQRNGMHVIMTGSSGMGKNTAYYLMEKIHKWTKHFIVEFLNKYKLEYNILAYDYIFTVSRLKLAYIEAGKRDGQGLVCFVEGTSELSQIAKNNPEDAIQFLTTMADEKANGQFFCSSTYDAKAVELLRTMVYVVGTTRMMIDLNNMADRGITNRGICIHVVPPRGQTAQKPSIDSGGFENPQEVDDLLPEETINNDAMIMSDKYNETSLNSMTVEEKYIRMVGYQQFQIWKDCQWHFDGLSDEPTHFYGLEFCVADSRVEQRKYDYFKLNGTTDGYEVPTKWIDPNTGLPRRELMNGGDCFVQADLMIAEWEARRDLHPGAFALLPRLKKIMYNVGTYLWLDYLCHERIKSTMDSLSLNYQKDTVVPYFCLKSGLNFAVAQVMQQDAISRIVDSVALRGQPGFRSHSNSNSSSDLVAPALRSRLDQKRVDVLRALMLSQGKEVNVSSFRQKCNIQLPGGTATYIKDTFDAWVGLGMITIESKARKAGKHGGARHKIIIATKIASDQWQEEHKKSIIKIFDNCDVSTEEWDATIEAAQSDASGAEDPPPAPQQPPAASGAAGRGLNASNNASDASDGALAGNINRAPARNPFMRFTQSAQKMEKTQKNRKNKNRMQNLSTGLSGVSGARGIGVLSGMNGVSGSVGNVSSVSGVIAGNARNFGSVGNFHSVGSVRRAHGHASSQNNNNNNLFESSLSGLQENIASLANVGSVGSVGRVGRARNQMNNVFESAQHQMHARENNVSDREYSSASESDQKGAQMPHTHTRGMDQMIACESEDDANNQPDNFEPRRLLNDHLSQQKDIFPNFRHEHESDQSEDESDPSQEGSDAFGLSNLSLNRSQRASRDRSNFDPVTPRNLSNLLSHTPTTRTSKLMPARDSKQIQSRLAADQNNHQNQSKPAEVAEEPSEEVMEQDLKLRAAEFRSKYGKYARKKTERIEIIKHFYAQKTGSNSSQNLSQTSPKSFLFPSAAQSSSVDPTGGVETHCVDQRRYRPQKGSKKAKPSKPSRPSKTSKSDQKDAFLALAKKVGQGGNKSRRFAAKRK